MIHCRRTFASEINLNAAQPRALRWATRYLGSVLGKDAHKGVGSGLQAPLKEARAQVLRPVHHLQGGGGSSAGRDGPAGVTAAPARLTCLYLSHWYGRPGFL